MSQVLQVVESSVVTVILCFAEQPQVLRQSHPRLYDSFKDIYGSVCDLFADEEEGKDGCATSPSEEARSNPGGRSKLAK